MSSTIISAASTGQPLPGTSNIIHVTSNTGFSTSGKLVIFLQSDGLAAVVSYTGKGTNTFTGCQSVNTDSMTTGDVVIDYTTYLTTYMNSVQIDGLAKRVPGNGITGNPTSSYGEYGLFNYSTMDSSTDTTVLQKTQALPFVTPSGGLTSYFKMVGYYVTGAVYEDFTVTGAPTTPSFTNPNTGHALINCYVSTFWQQ